MKNLILPIAMLILGFLLGYNFSEVNNKDGNQNDPPTLSAFDRVIQNYAIANFHGFTDENIYGEPIKESVAKQYAKYGHDTRCYLRCLEPDNDTTLVKSVYFSTGRLRQWGDSLANSIGTSVDSIGYRFFFAQYPDDYKKVEDFNGKSTMVIRAMKAVAKDSIAYITEGEANMNVAFNVGNLCPPRCLD